MYPSIPRRFYLFPRSHLVPCLVQEGLLQNLHKSRSSLLLDGSLLFSLLQLGLQLELLLDLLSLGGGVRGGRVNQRSNGIGKIGGKYSESLGQSVDLGLNVVVSGREDFALGSSLSCSLGRLLTSARGIP